MMLVPLKAAIADQPGRQGQAKHRGQGSTSDVATNLADFGRWKELSTVENITQIGRFSDIYLVHGNTQ